MDLDKLFYPDSVAVVGVSDNPDNMARAIVSNLISWGFAGPVYSVNPKGGRAFDKDIYKSLTDIPAPVGLAAILSPARTIPDIIDQAHEKGIEYLCIETAGFSELDGGGSALAEIINKKALEYGIKFVGPNGLGIVNAENRLFLPFIYLTPWSPPGPVSVIAQSGGVGLAILNGIQEHNLTANKFVSLGNKYSLDEVDFLRYFIKDESTKIILIYLEGMKRGREFAEAAAKSSKPILLFKANTTRAGAERAQSHTAALASDDRILDAAVKRAGVTRVHSLEQLIQYAVTFAQPPMKGRNVTIVSPAGGLTVIAADCAEEQGFRFPALSPETEVEIKKRLRSSVIRLGNPIDLGDGFSTDTQMLAIDMMLAQNDVDGAMFITSRRQPSDYRGAAKEMLRNPAPDLAELSNKHNKPVITAFVASAALVREYRADLKVPIYNSPEMAIKALAAYRDFCMREKSAGFAEAAEAPRKALGLIADMKSGLVAGAAAFDALEAAGVPVVPFLETDDEEQAIKSAEKMGFPVAMKLVSREIVHKTEAGALRLNLKTEYEARAAFKQLLEILTEKEIRGKILVQKMASAGVEAIIGSRSDPHFGQVLMFGLGGIYVEILKDVVFQLAPVSREEALSMIESIKTAALLRGARGATAADIDALANAIVAVGQLISSCPSIVELDINPMIVFEQGAGCAAVDARIVIG
ncbi:MAG: acetate--CoA ligase family protein [bacterium]